MSCLMAHACVRTAFMHVAGYVAVKNSLLFSNILNPDAAKLSVITEIHKYITFYGRIIDFVSKITIVEVYGE